jgi:hypothetical protein
MTNLKRQKNLSADNRPHPIISHPLETVKSQSLKPRLSHRVKKKRRKQELKSTRKWKRMLKKKYKYRPKIR